MSKLTLLACSFVLFTFAIIGKLAYIQIFSSDRYSSNIYLKTQRIDPSRGEIFDRHGDPLVLNKTLYKLIVEPKNVKNKDILMMKLDKALGIGMATLEAKFAPNRDWIPIKSDIELSVKQKIDKLDLDGVIFEDSEKRYYPESSVAAHLMGFVGKDDKADDVGYFGLEGYFDKDLDGLPGLVKTERDVFGKPIFVGVQDVVTGENGRDLILTIDKTAQMLVKKHLKSAVEKYGAESGCVIIMDPYSGGIIAMSCLPDYDPDNYGEFTQDSFINPAISVAFEPGSIFKPTIMALALEKKAVKPSDTIVENGPVKIGSYTISNWDNKYKGEITMSQILEYSSNIGMVAIASKLKQSEIQKGLSDYGFGAKTGIDLQGEALGLVKNKSSWYKIDNATVAFGQGIAVTPIQMLTAFASLVNGGWIVKPYTVIEMRSDQGVKRIKPVRLRRILSEKTSREVKTMLKAAVEHGEVKWKIPSGYEFGGKTGTAQIPIEGRYDATQTIASFVGFVPYDKPRFIALVTIRKPQTSQWGSETAAPLFFDIARELLVYYGIPPKN